MSRKLSLPNPLPCSGPWAHSRPHFTNQPQSREVAELGQGPSPALRMLPLPLVPLTLRSSPTSSLGTWVLQVTHHWLQFLPHNLLKNNGISPLPCPLWPSPLLTQAVAEAEKAPWVNLC